MALTPRSLRTTSTAAALLRINSILNTPQTFAADAGAATVELVAGTPVAFNTSTNLWVPWVQGGSNGIDIISGIVWPDSITILATGGGEVIGSVMRRGEIHYEDFQLLAAQGTAAQLITALQEGGSAAALRTLGIDVKGLDLVI